MPTFQYQGKEGGKACDGTLDAPSRQAALRTLSRRKIQPTKLELKSDLATSAPKKKATPAPSSDKKTTDTTPSTTDGQIRLKTPDIVTFSEELGDLLLSGMRLEPALHLLAGAGKETAGKGVRIVSALAREKVRDGYPLSQALHAICPNFGESYCSVIESGEATGSLGTVLQRHARHLKQSEKLKGEVLASLAYPGFLLIAGIFLVALFVGFLIPRLTQLLESTGAELSTFVKLIIGGSGFIAGFGIYIVIAVVIAVIAAVVILRMPSVRPWWEEFRLRLVPIGGIESARCHVIFLQSLGNLVENGMPLERAVALAGKAVPNGHFKGRLSGIADLVRDGAPLSKAFERSGVIEDPAPDLIRVGEESGQIGRALTKASERFEQMLSKRISRVTSILQPVVILLMAALIGVVAYIMMNVIYETMRSIRSTR